MSAAFLEYLSAGLRSPAFPPDDHAERAANPTMRQPFLHAFDHWEIEHPSLRLRRLACLMFAVDVPDLRDGVRAAIESVRAARSTMWREKVELKWQAEYQLELILRDYRTAQRDARREREAA